MASFGRQERDVEHAMWRVNFVSSLLQSHRSLRSRDMEWQEQETDYQERLKAAWLELERLRALQRPPGQPPPDVHAPDAEAPSSSPTSPAAAEGEAEGS